MSWLRGTLKRIPLGVWLALALLLAAGVHFALPSRDAQAQPGMVGVIAPDGMTASDPQLSVWLDALNEQGIRNESVTVSSLISEGVFNKHPPLDYRVLIVPDQVLRRSDVRVTRVLKAFVEAGGQLLVCFDAMSRTGEGAHWGDAAPLSALVGLEYGMFDTLGAGAVAYGPALGSDDTMSLLQSPPGKAVPWPPSKSGQLAWTTYQYGFVMYPHLVTRGAYPGKVLLESSDGSVLLGERQLGRGGVMFANLPLGDLKGRTDGLPLHAVLQHLAEVVGLPTLASAPKGIGGLIFNWHIDANTALPALAEFDKRGLFAQGPFSIHFTTGPDAHKPGDKAGMDLEHNPKMQQWIKRFKERGDGLGNHGGWIHDYFGTRVGQEPNSEMESLLERNDAVLRAVAQAPILEYSAPLGNQPLWVTEWIERRGVLGYYFTGNTGMAPTRSYRDGKLSAHKIWSFPILTLNQIASFEEAYENSVPANYMEDWLISVAEFSANSGTVRTFYSHPPGWQLYFDAIGHWFQRTAELAQEGRFHWYTMEQMAQFLNRREEVRWQVTLQAGKEVFQASHADSLADMAWRLPKSRYSRPVVEQGNAQVRDADDAWMLVATDGKSLTFSASTPMEKLPP